MRLLRRIALTAALLPHLICCAQSEDSLRVPDTLGATQPAPALWPDSASGLADSLAGGGVADQWLWPVAVIVVSASIVYLLFTVRSK